MELGLSLNDYFKPGHSMNFFEILEHFGYSNSHSSDFPESLVKHPYLL